MLTGNTVVVQAVTLGMGLPRFNAPVTALLVAAVTAVYALERGGLLDASDLGFVPAHPSAQGAFLSLFLHDPGNLAHVGGNLLFLAVLGAIVEGSLGSLRFGALYAAAGLGGVALHWAVDPAATTALVGCSGALFGLLALAAILRPGLLGFTVAFVTINIWQAFHGGDGTASFGAHLGGFVVGFIHAAAMRLTGALEAPELE